MPNKNKPLSFDESAKVRDGEVPKITSAVTRGYKKVADEIHASYRRYERSDSTSATAVRGLAAQVAAGSSRVTREYEKQLISSMHTVSKAVAKDGERWVAELTGKTPVFKNYKPFSDEIVRRVSSGKLYKGKLSLSKRIWQERDNLEQTVRNIIAGGLKKGWSVYEIAMSVESYVRPDAVKQWNLTGPDGKRIWPGSVDLNAARVVRTTLQHAYQQAIVDEVEANPFVDKVRWIASGAHPCPLCQDRDGRIYDVEDLPLDHPNGQCTFEPIMDKDWPKRLGRWVEGGKDKEIDEFMDAYGIDLEDF